ncbi:unnamed protein product, partial [Amoebophrya sp. A25]
FNEPNLGQWNVATVERVHRAFDGAEEFAQPLNTWDLSKAFEVWLNEESTQDFPPLSLFTFDSFLESLEWGRSKKSICDSPPEFWPRDPTKKTRKGHIALSLMSRASASKS